MTKMKYEIIRQEGLAKRAHMETVHGTIETPVFMNVMWPQLPRSREGSAPTTSEA